MPKSAFVSAQKEVETFVYPHPLNDPDVDDDTRSRERFIDPEVLKDENGKEVPESELPWIKVRVPRSAKDVDKVADLTQPAMLLSNNGDGTGAETRIARMNKGLFELLVEGWSFTEGKPGVELYDRLDTWAAVWVRHCCGEANRRGSVDFREPTPSSSKPAATSRAKSPAASPAE